MRKVLLTFSVLWVLFFGVMLYLGSPAEASLIDVDTLAVDYVHYFPKGRAPLVSDNGLDDRELGSRLGMDLTLGFPTVFYSKTRVESYADHDWTNGGGQFRSISLELELGARVIDQVDVFYHHRSQHVLDHEYRQGFPVEDGIGFRLKILGGSK